MALKSPISMLQEILASKNMMLPEYTFSDTGTQIQPEFTCDVTCPMVMASGKSRTKKEAKNQAAMNALEKMGISTRNKTSSIESISKSSSIFTPKHNLPEDFIDARNYVGLLNETASKAGNEYAEYREALFAEDGRFKCICVFRKYETVGFGTTKKQAKQVASFEMLSRLKICSPDVSNVQRMHKKMVGNELEERDLNMVKKFQELSMFSRNKTSILKQIEGNQLIETNHLTKKEALDEIAKWGYTCQVLVLEEYPFEVVAEIEEKEITVMSHSDNEEVAITSALNEVLLVLKQGCKKFGD